jgi:NAD(P) transhydrogenase subunit alpha
MTELIVLVAVFAGALVVGYLLISRVPQLLHTPLMSLTNAVSAVTVLGALLLFGSRPSAAEAVIGTLAVILAMFNVIGGLAITGRMLRFFKKG